ncbi:hypothetical protein [Leekyejoonella antrihumi]|uniref:Uncharacterized protein n=1 Tax=Leekyejoonella antrihumi TaxID=1660198 RepID=A0A563E224_9MICO|nr:hypothetical protein [Leekyejoonella antrihumi]TWP35954.1 hypothetical protein FGL98_12030 [Leekyejoonella antrihumi]
MTAQILRIVRTSLSTTVVWRLKSTSGATVPTNSSQLSGAAPLFDTRQLALVDVEGNKTFYPYTYVPIGQPTGLDTKCLCSDLPDSVSGGGVVLYAMMPALPAGASTVNVSIPGFSTMKSVKVAS